MGGKKTVRAIDLNADLGEGGAHEVQMLPFLSSANVATGVYAGTRRDAWMLAEQALSQGVVIGAHIGYPDRDRFGRQSWQQTGLEPSEIRASLREQTEAITARFPIKYLKPHGAFYNESLADPDARLWLKQLLLEFRLPLLGLMGSAHAELAKNAGVTFFAEAFADRGYTDDGLLLPRSEPGAVLSEPTEILAQVDRFVGHADSICLHGDHEGAVERAAMIHHHLIRQGTLVQPCA